MDFAIGGQNLMVFRLEWSFIEVGNPAAGFPGNQHSGGRVPRFQVFFPESVKPAACNVA
jgi:hypothetical protein